MSILFHVHCTPTKFFFTDELQEVIARGLAVGFQTLGMPVPPPPPDLPHKENLVRPSRFVPKCVE